MKKNHTKGQKIKPKKTLLASENKKEPRWFLFLSLSLALAFYLYIYRERERDIE